MKEQTRRVEGAERRIKRKWRKKKSWSRSRNR